MNALALYALKAAVSLALLYLPYRLLLRHETFFRFNRFALLGILVASMILPGIHLNISSEVLPAETLPTIWLSDDVPVVVPAESLPEAAVWDWTTILAIVYLIGVSLAAARRIRQFATLHRFITRCGHSAHEDGYTLHLHSDDCPPFSWMRHIVLPKGDNHKEFTEILLHEKAHARLGHSWDNCFLMLCEALQWFNPLIYLLGKDLCDAHEFEADHAVLQAGADARDYQFMLIKKAVGDRSFNIANSLSNNNLKKRIKMMTRKTSNPWRRLRLLYLLPVAAIIVAVSSRAEAQEQTALQILENNSVQKNADPFNAFFKNASKAEDVTVAGTQAAPGDDDKHAIENPDVKPKFPGGEAAFMKYISNNARYPDTALKSGKKGIVGVSFVVKKNGDVTNVEVTQSVSPELDAEAVRVIKASPKWKPGMVNGVPVDVKMKVPFRFQFHSGKVMTKAPKSVSVSGPTTPRVVSVSTKACKQSLEGVPQTVIGKPDSEGKNPKFAIVVNDKVLSAEETAKITEEDIAHIVVMHGDQSAKYGEKAKEGVAILKLKKK